MILQFVHVSMIILAHRLIADLNVPSIQNVHRIKPVINLNVQIRVQERVEVSVDDNRNSFSILLKILKIYFLQQ